MKIIAIYKITSPSGRIYIGQSWNLQNRLYAYRGVHCKAQPKLFNSLKKYGFSSHTFEVLQYFPQEVEQKTLDNLEVFCISQYSESGCSMLNLRGGGANGKQDKESIEKMRAALKITINTPEYKKKIGLIRKGKAPSKLAMERSRQTNLLRTYQPHTEETRTKLRIAHTGKKYGPCSAEKKLKLRIANKGQKGRPCTEEQKEYLRKINTGKIMSIEANRRTALARSIPVLQYDKQGNFIREWVSAKEACKSLGYHRGHMTNTIKSNTYYKEFKWVKKPTALPAIFFGQLK